MAGIGTFGLVLIALAFFFIISAIKILNEYERGVIFRLGRALHWAKGPGLIILIPMVDNLVKVNLQLVTYEVPSQDVITRDNVTVKVNAVVYFRVIDPLKAIIEVRDYYAATQLLAQTTLRSVCGQVELDDLLAEREKVNAQLAEILDNQTEPWGIKVTLVEVLHRPTHRNAAGHRQTGRSGAGAAGQGDQRRRRIPGRRQDG